MFDLPKLARKWQQCWLDRDRSIDDFMRSDALQERDSQQDRLASEVGSESTQPPCERVFQLLVAAYTQPDRHYHNLYHIEHLLSILDRFTATDGDRSLHTLQDPISVSLAAWFHDYIYNSQASDNELQSANAARELLTNIGTIDAYQSRQILSRIDRIQQLILATSGHQTDPNDSDLCIFLDADLAILGVDPARYQAYARAIRLEYSWVSDLDYRAGRVSVLESFLKRDKLYYTDVLFDELESIARLNLESEIVSLQAVKSPIF
ncbi:hypothetical protein [Chamaesiphon minutus]|uniref:HD superfamily hydrolase n=1 Tax=Chamaesiphon minutus (strain ATCC 27169 / PCC 6605) TaxID=1173020 RepID=K9ULP5_CHAP6|nr:hypothetical protein [Chamaesiphon minutus]AFY95341.1 hypothetical protein Cha6605_4408 [Chamaesiphon minutus PCC 6605]